jgi:inosose dehydratase
MNSRREFLQQLSGYAVGLVHSDGVLARMVRRMADIKVGCAAITWGGNDDQAMADISALGYPGIQLRANAVARFRERPGELRDILARHRLTLVALSSGNVSIDPAREAEVIAQHVGHAQFLRDAGGLYLQLIDERPRGRERESADFARLGRLLTEIGKRAADLGISVGYHHHIGSIGEKPEEVERVLDASDAKYVRLLLDVAHYQVGGGDPAAAIRRHAERLLFLHIKDVRMPVPGASGAPFQFVELGRGSVDLPAVFTALREVRFNGWCVVELDGVPEPGRTPKAANAISRRYLERVIGLRVS